MVTYPEDGGEIHVAVNTPAAILTSTESQSGYVNVIDLYANHECTICLQFSKGNIWMDYSRVKLNRSHSQQRVYPTGKVRVWVVNDESSDDSSQLVRATLDRDGTAPTTTYCSPEDVARIMQLYTNDGAVKSFRGDTQPSREDVIISIQRAEEFIDRYTHHSWKTTTVTDEYYDFRPPREWGPYERRTDERALYLRHRKIKTFTSGTDKLEVWDGSTWVEYIANKTEGRSEDYYVDYNKGVIYFQNSYPVYSRNAVRMTYRYGEDTVAAPIRDACAMLTAAEIAVNNDNMVVLPEGGGEFKIPDKVDYWRRTAEHILAEYVEVESV